MPMRLAGDEGTTSRVRATLVEGLSTAIDDVAAAAPATHRFLRYQWFASAVAVYGGPATTLVVEEDGRPVLAMPLVPVGPRMARIAVVPGSYWPFRAPVTAEGATGAVARAALALLARHRRAIRIGPVPDSDSGVTMLVEAARASGWTAIDRVIGTTWIFRMADAAAGGAWPRNSTLRKNRFFEKHLGEHGALDWSFLTGGDWPAGFDALGAIETRSWVGQEGLDAKFTMQGRHGAFWRRAMADPVLAGMARAALLRIDGAPAAFSFDLDAGPWRYAIANSYDPQFARQSPGRLLVYRNLADALARGVRDVDWGIGDSGYKETLGSEPGPAMRDWLLCAPCVSALAGRLMAETWRRSARV
ncbi:GNAT family N-acetyltransferase [Sphingomonas sp. NY01]|uniref:GNAT family N-acetyltransferase n=1 Tax=Sphingomonas sp. NY01 TaxID=2968057 RepID=UPI00315E00C3